MTFDNFPPGRGGCCMSFVLFYGIDRLYVQAQNRVLENTFMHNFSNRKILFLKIDLDIFIL